MRLLPSDKYNVAWFKLAEFVARGEKERALGLYRLLVHSFDDVALAHQLQADLLWSFKDHQAFDLYQKAAEVHMQSGKTLQAAALFEHLLSIRPCYRYYIDQLEHLYCSINAREQLSLLYQDIVVAAVDVDDALVEKYLESAVAETIKHGSSQSYNAFLQRLKSTNDAVYTKALTIAQNAAFE